jgi:hypothetical protein
MCGAMNGATALAETIVILQRNARAGDRRRPLCSATDAGEVTTMTPTPTATLRASDACPSGDHAPLFVSRRRAWLHAVLAGQERAPARRS